LPFYAGATKLVKNVFYILFNLGGGI